MVTLADEQVDWLADRIADGPERACSSASLAGFKTTADRARDMKSALSFFKGTLSLDALSCYSRSFSDGF